MEVAAKLIPKEKNIRAIEAQRRPLAPSNIDKTVARPLTHQVPRRRAVSFSYPRRASAMWRLAAPPAPSPGTAPALPPDRPSTAARLTPPAYKPPAAVAGPGQLGQAWRMNETTGLKIFAAPGAALILIGVGYAYGLVGGCPRPTPENALPRDLTLAAAGLVLASGTAIAGYRAGTRNRGKD